MKKFRKVLFLWVFMCAEICVLADAIALTEVGLRPNAMFDNVEISGNEKERMLKTAIIVSPEKQVISFWSEAAEAGLGRAWEKIREFCKEDIHRLREMSFEEFVDFTEARPVDSSLQQIFGGNRLFYLSPDWYRDMLEDSLEISDSFSEFGITGSGIYYIENDYDLEASMMLADFKEKRRIRKMFGIRSLDIMSTIPKSQLFHEFCEKVLDEQKIIDAAGSYLGHSSLAVIKAELLFAALMSKEEFSYQLNLRIRNFDNQLENNSEWPEDIKEMIQQYLNTLKKEKADFKASRRRYKEEAMNKFKNGGIDFNHSAIVPFFVNRENL